MTAPDPDEDDTMAVLLPFPGARAEAEGVATDEPTTHPSTDVEVAPPVFDSEIVDDEPRRSTAVAVPVDLPLTPRHAGHLRYVGSVAVHGARRAPVVIVNSMLDRRKHADLREGQTRHGAVAAHHAAEYSTRLDDRRKRAANRRAAVLKAATAPWTQWKPRGTTGIKRIPLSAVTTTATVGSLAAAAYPQVALLTPFRLLDEVIGTLASTAGTLAWQLSENVVGATWPYLVPGAIVAGIGYGITAEHRRRQNIATQIGAEHPLIAGPEQAVAGEHADRLTSAFLAAGIIRAGQQVLLTGVPYQVPNGICAPILLPEGVYTAQLRHADRLEKLASVLDTTPQHLSVLDGASVRRCSLIVYTKLPFTGPAVPHPLLGSGRAHSLLRDGLPAGLTVDGETIAINVADDLHGLIVAASGMGKTVHLRNLILSVLHSCDGELGGIFDGKSSGDYDLVRPQGCTYLEPEQSGADWWVQVADWLEAEVAEGVARQQRKRRGETLNLRFVILDEFQIAFGYPSDRTKDSAATRVLAAVDVLSRQGRSAGMRLVLASQSFDGNVLPKGIGANILWRLVGYVSSEAMDPKDTVGSQGAGLVPDKVFTPAQKGAVIALSSTLPNGRALCRGWHQDDEVIAGDVRAALGDPALRTSVVRDVDVPELLSALIAYLDECVADGDDREHVPSVELYEEVVQARGLLHDGELMTLTRMGSLLASWGVAKGREGRGSAMSRSVADLRAAYHRVCRGGRLVVTEGDGR